MIGLAGEILFCSQLSTHRHFIYAVFIPYDGWHRWREILSFYKNICDDFYVAGKEDTELQYDQAKQFVSEVERYINENI